MARRSYSGGAQATTLASGISSVGTVVSAVALVSWPNPANGPFFAVLDKGLPTEEKILCTAVNGNDLTVLRGQDGTIARDHSSGAALEHVHTATDADEANAHVNAISGVHGMPVGDGFVYRDATQTIKNKTMDYGVSGGNQATNLPRAASPEIDGALTAEANTRAAADATLAQWDEDHVNWDESPNPHPRYQQADQVRSIVLEALPIGSITMWGGLTAPPGWLPCDGTVRSESAFTALAALLAGRFNTGAEGANNFRLPNFNGRVPRGAGSNGSNTYAVAQSGGADSRAIAAANLPPHAHTINHDHGSVTTSAVNAVPAGGRVYTGSTGVDTAGSGASAITASAAVGTHQHTVDLPLFSGSSGNGPGTSTAFDTRDPFLGITFIIRAL